jgi:hypothetical protein
VASSAWLRPEKKLFTGTSDCKWRQRTREPSADFEEPIQMLPTIQKSSIKNGGSDDDFKSNNRAMYRGVFAVLTLVLSMPR